MRKRLSKKKLVEVAKDRERAVFDTFKSGINMKDNPGMVGMGEFAAMMAMQSLIMKESEIIQCEHYEKETGKKHDLINVKGAREEYVKMRRELIAEMGHAAFIKMYRSAKKSHNSCERANLDNSDGNIYAYVLPDFHEDGTHEPWGAKDVPWNVYKRK